MYNMGQLVLYLVRSIRNNSVLSFNLTLVQPLCLTSLYAYFVSSSCPHLTSILASTSCPKLGS
jgi:hypothetical protein